MCAAEAEKDAVPGAITTPGSSMDSTDPKDDATGDDKSAAKTCAESPTSKNDPEKTSRCRAAIQRLVAFYWKYEFLVLAILAILLAKAYPPLGAVYLAPQITATWIAVVVIFFLSGINLRTEEFLKALQQLWFNAFVQGYNFLAISAVVYGVSRGLIAGGVLGRSLADGMVICACLPMQINTVIVFTRTAGGDEASALVNSAFGNVVGPFLSPALILGYLGVSGSVDVADAFAKLAMKVLLPLALGQLVRKLSRRGMELARRYKRYLDKVQQYCIIFIIYCTFCKTFMQGLGGSVSEVMIMLVFQSLLLIILMIASWYAVKLLFRDKPKQQVFGLLGCTSKTAAVGVPLINALYQNDPAVGLYTLPLIIWYTLQLVLGSALLGPLAAFVAREEARLAAAAAADGGGAAAEPDCETGEGAAAAADGGEKGDDDEEDDPHGARAAAAAALSSCVALPWARAALAGAQESDCTDGEALDVSVSELDALSLASSGPRSVALAAAAADTSLVDTSLEDE